jgi:hypothetical protein
MQEEAIEIAATQTKSACADFVITGVAFPGFGMMPEALKAREPGTCVGVHFHDYLFGCTQM